MGIPFTGMIIDWLVLMTTLPMKYWSELRGQGQFTVQGKNCALIASGALKMIGSWAWSIQPLFQLMRGWVSVNQGYLRITLFSPSSDRKNRKAVC
jgi:hypothetical protein